MKVIFFEDKGVYFVCLKRGTYQIDGKIISNDSFKDIKVEIKDINSIRYVNNNEIVDYYLDESNNRVEVFEYKNYKDKLEGECFDEYGNYLDLNLEYKYRKFIESYMPIKKKIQLISEPIEVELERSVFEPENIFIENLFKYQDKETNLYVYRRLNALRNIIASKFDELGFEFIEKCSYAETNKVKKWGNNHKDSIEYTVAFGTYLFSNYKVVCDVKGSLANLEEAYKTDKEKIERIIENEYNLHFRSIDGQRIRKYILTLREKIAKSNFKIKSKYSKNELLSYIKKIENELVSNKKQNGV